MELCLDSSVRVYKLLNSTCLGFLDFILSQYIQEGGGELGEEKLPTFIELKYGTPRDAVAELGQVGEIREMFLGFQRYLYEPAEVAG